MREIRIDHCGAGQWIMQQVNGVFTAGSDHSFSSHDGDKILGGFVLTYFIGGSITVHMASQDKRWCSRELLWLVFDYAFNQLGCYKMLTPLPSNDHSVINMDMRAGWELEAVVRDAFAPGVHMLILGMTKDRCPWLDYQPRTWHSNKVITGSSSVVH